MSSHWADLLVVPPYVAFLSLPALLYRTLYQHRVTKQTIVVPLAATNIFNCHRVAKPYYREEFRPGARTRAIQINRDNIQ